MNANSTSNKKPKPAFSVLIASYNNGNYIAEALESVLQQSFTNWEVIIVDDASTDNSLQMIEYYLCDERVKLFRNDKNYGCGFTKRRAASRASGGICGFLDADDTLLPGALQIMVKEHVQHPGCSIIYSNHFVCDHDLKNPVKSEYTGSMPAGYSYLVNPGSKSISHFATFKKSKYDKTRGISAALKKAVDQDLYYKLEETAPVKYIDEYLYNYRMHKGGISTGKNAVPALIQFYRVRLKALKKRLAIKKGLALYPKDRYLIKYQYCRCSFYFNKLSGSKLKACGFLAVLLIRWPVMFIRDMQHGKARRPV